MWKVAKAVGLTLALMGWGIAASNALFWFYPGAFLGLGIYGAAQRAAYVASNQPAPSLSPADLNAVLLAVATIVLAVVAFFLSIGAFFGYGELKSVVFRLAEQEQKKIASDFERLSAKNEGQLRALIFQYQAELASNSERIREEISQSLGLPEGKEADSIAQASSSEGS